MRSPAGWAEPHQTPDFDEVTLVLAGVVRVESAAGKLDVAAGEAVLTRLGPTAGFLTRGAGAFPSRNSFST